MLRKSLVGIATVALAAVAGFAQAGTITVAWDPVSGASGYIVYYGTSPGNYTQQVDAGGSTRATLNVGDCADYYVSVKAYNGAGLSAQYSNEVSGWAKPSMTPISNIQRTQGEQFTMNVSGANFQPGSTFSFDTSNLPTDAAGGDLVRVDSYSVTSCNNIQALVSIEPASRGFRAMEVGQFNVPLEVVNPDGIRGAGVAFVNVGFARERADINRSNSTTQDRVDGSDLAWLAYAYGEGETDPRFNADADLNGDGLVDGQDLAFLAADFGRCWTGTTWTEGACP